MHCCYPGTRAGPACRGGLRWGILLFIHLDHDASEVGSDSMCGCARAQISCCFLGISFEVCIRASMWCCSICYLASLGQHYHGKDSVATFEVYLLLQP